MNESATRTAALVPRPDPMPVNPLRALASPYTALATIHLVSSPLIGAVTFSVVIVLLALSVSLVVVGLIGVPIFVLTVHVVRAMSEFERARFRLTLGMELPAPALPRRQGSYLRYAAALVSSPVVWREIAYHLVLLPWGVVTCVVTTIAWMVPLTLVALPLYFFALPKEAMDLGVLTVGDAPTAFAAALAGAVLLVVVPPGIVRALRLVDAEVGRSLLGAMGSEELADRVDVLTETRTRAVDSAQAERLRIERDLHDGAQQRLVSLAMTLGRAKSRMADDDARRLVDEAHQEAKQAITELRDLTRGLQPPVLADRGLDAALSALAARSPVPVEVEVDLSPRPSPTVEAIAYFVVAESLANVAKHSGARRAWVHARRDGGEVRVVIGDDGMGGADAARGSGIAGISDRISGVDGTLTVHSPAGGPTLVTVVLPCA